jgi:hypothetical protein
MRVMSGLIMGILLLAFADLGAQERAELPDSPLTHAALDFAAHWAGGNSDSLSGHLAASGIRLHLEGPARSAIPARQATAAIREFLRNFEDGEATVVRAAEVGDQEDRGFAEFHWKARVSGTSHRVEHTLFLSMIRVEDRWRVEELRLVR